jgi:hypothetical protein
MDCSMSSLSNSWTRDAWKAAPRADSSDGLMAVVEVEGARMLVFSGKMLRASWAILGVCEVPPEKITWVDCQYRCK